MQDDFGDFHQAPSAVLHQGPSTKQNGNLNKDLNSKIMESFDLSGSSQKASIRFQNKPQQMGKRPPSMQYKPSSGAADWKNLDIKTSDFTVKMQAPTLQPRKSQILQQPRYAPSAFMPGANANQNPRYQYLPGNVPAVSHYGLPNQLLQMPVQVNGFQNTANSNSSVASSYGAFVNQPTLQNLPIHSNELPIHRFHSPQIASEINVCNNLSAFSNFQHPDNNKLNNLTSTYVVSATHGVNNTSDEITLPSWMTKPNDIPQIYKDVLKLCATPNSYADTARLYPILLSSKLPKDVLGHIWSAANQSVPGQLTFSEVYIALGLIALAQKGELNLSVKYVTNLKTAPVPNLELATSFTETQTSAGTISVMTQKSNSPSDFKNTAADDEFADFQSFPSRIESTMFQSSVSSNNAHSADIKKLQSLVPICSNDTSPMCPASSQSISLSKSTGDLLNSCSVTGNVNNGKLPGSNPNSYNKDLFSSGFTNYGDLNKSDMLHQDSGLPVQNRSVSARNLFVVPVPTNNNSGQTAGDDFGDFKASVFVSSIGNKSTPVPSLGKTSNPDIFSMPIVETTGTQPIEERLIGSDDLIDKYSALRGLTPSVPEDVGTGSETLEVDDFADFQSVSAQPSNETFSTTSFKPHLAFEKNAFEKEDSASVSSLELPSLSKTISSLSIGSMSPAKGAEESFWGLSNGRSDVAVGKLANEKGCLETNITVNSQPSFSDAVATKPMSSQEDGLYSLEEPISPPSQKKITHEETSIKNELQISTSRDKKQIAVPRHVAEPDSEFGDFASCLPPIDDTRDHLNYEFDMFQGGNSSLVDFDAFGHFQEAKEEVKKRPEIKIVRKESTAYSEFVASQALPEKPDTSEIVNDTSVDDLKNTPESREDWSGFNGRDTEQRHIHTINLESEFAAFEDKITTSQKSLVSDENGSIKQDSFVVKKPWKLESTISDESSNFQTEYSKWDAEGQDMKARMEGTDAISTKELYTDHWGRCLATCKDIIVSTSEIFAALNSPSVCHEIVNSTRGKEFISCTSEVYGISRRICKGMKSVNLSDDDLEQTIKEIEIAWNNLLGFCPYTPSVHKTPEHCSSTPNLEQTEENDIAGHRACGLCLLSIVDSSLSGLEYGGKSYHAPCANLWLNQIAPILPRLNVPSVF